MFATALCGFHPFAVTTIFRLGSRALLPCFTLCRKEIEKRIAGSSDGQTLMVNGTGGESSSVSISSERAL